MVQVNMLEAKNNLSKIVYAVESGAEDAIIIARHGKPAVKIVPYTPDVSNRIGAAKGMKLVADDWDINEGDDEIVAMFEALQ